MVHAEYSAVQERAGSVRQACHLPHRQPECPGRLLRRATGRERQKRGGQQTERCQSLPRAAGKKRNQELREGARYIAPVPKYSRVWRQHRVLSCLQQLRFPERNNEWRAERHVGGSATKSHAALRDSAVTACVRGSKAGKRRKRGKAARRA